MARSWPTSTSASASRSRRMSGSLEMSSTVTETETSEVDTMSTGVSCRAKTSKRVFRKPASISIRLVCMSTVAIPFLKAIERTREGPGGADARTSVPGSSGSRELRIRTGIPCACNLDTQLLARLAIFSGRAAIMRQMGICVSASLRW